MIWACAAVSIRMRLFQMRRSDSAGREEISVSSANYFTRLPCLIMRSTRCKRSM
jgi:hypothetical protein